MKSTRVLCQTVNILLIMGWLTTVCHVFDTFWLELTQASIALHRLSYRRWLTALNCTFQQWKELASGPIFNWFTFPAALVNFGEGVHSVEWQWEWEEKEKKAKWPKWTQLRLSFASYSAWFMSPGASLTASRFCSLLQEKPSHSNLELEWHSFPPRLHFTQLKQRKRVQQPHNMDWWQTFSCIIWKWWFVSNLKI